MENRRERKSSSSSQSSSSSSEKETFEEAKEVMETSQVDQQCTKEEDTWKQTLNQAWRNSLGEVDEKVLNGLAEMKSGSVQLTAAQASQESSPKSITVAADAQQEESLDKIEKVTSSVQQVSQESSSKSETVISYVQQVSQESLSNSEQGTSYIRQASQESKSEIVSSYVQQSQQIQVVSSSRARPRLSSSSSSQGAADMQDRVRSSSRGSRKSISEFSSQDSDGGSFSSTPVSPTSSKPPEIRRLIRQSSVSSGMSSEERDPPLSADEPVLNEMKFELSSWQQSRAQSVRKVKVTAHKPVSRSISHDTSVQNIYTGLMERHIKELKGKGVPGP